jgi:hypothetical protein
LNAEFAEEIKERTRMMASPASSAFLLCGLCVECFSLGLHGVRGRWIGDDASGADAPYLPPAVESILPCPARR